MSIDLSRFTLAQQRDFELAYREVSNGKKVSHWMWYIFPQVRGLGKRENSMFYAIQSLEEAKAFLADHYLGGNLRSISQVLLDLPSDDAWAIFGPVDTKKLRSCMTLFSCAAGGDSVFDRVLEKFFNGRPDEKTIRILGADAQ